MSGLSCSITVTSDRGERSLWWQPLPRLMRRELLVTLSAHIKRKLAQSRKPNQGAADPKAAARYSHGQLGFKEPAQSGKLPHSNA